MKEVLYVKQADESISTRIEINEELIGIQRNVPIPDKVNLDGKICGAHVAAVTLLKILRGNDITLAGILAYLLNPMTDSFSFQK